ncbi:MAG: ABC transporter substrate-binding protein [Nitrososphaerales archaeon]
MPIARSRRLRLALLVLALVALALAGWLVLRPREGALEDIQKRGSWRVGMDPSFPPFENLDAVSGQVVGLDADLAAALGLQLKIKTEIVSLGFDELIDAVAAHRIDAAISALPVIPERTQDVRFSDPYVQAGVVLAVPTGSAIRGTADLAGRRVAVEWGSQGDAEARRLLAAGKSQFELLPKETVAAALDATVAGKADAAVVDAISLALYGQSGQLSTVGEPLFSDPYVVVVAHDAPDLLSAINESLRTLETDGTLTSLRGRWLRAPNP